MPFQLPLNQLDLAIALRSSKLPESGRSSVATGVSTDTRSLKLGELFVALRGSSFDGHKFAAAAVDRGAIALVLEHPVEIEADCPQFYVEDTLAAYQQLGKWWRDRFTIPVVGITGSVGKTTTKELVAGVLATRGNVLKTEANYNNEIGVPKTVLRLNETHDFAVLEMAMRARGEIAQLTQIASPTVGLITNVGTAHIGRLGSEQAIADAKCELLAEMPSTGVAILNADNDRLMRTAAGVWSGETVTYGLENGDLRGEIGEGDRLLVEGWELPLPLPGRHNASNYLAALAVAKVLGVSWEPLREGLDVSLPGGRSRRYELPNEILLLDETYNAGLESTLAALELLAETPGTRHIAVLGTMKELGEMSAPLHRQVGEKAKHLGLDALLILADDLEAEEIAAGAVGMAAECFASYESLIERLQGMLCPGDRVLFKASHSVGLDRAVEAIRHALTDSK